MTHVRERPPSFSRGGEFVNIITNILNKLEHQIHVYYYNSVAN